MALQEPEKKMVWPIKKQAIDNSVTLSDNQSERNTSLASESEKGISNFVAGSDPVTSGFNAVQALFHLITASIPSDELQRERFKERYPLFYARIRIKTYNKILAHLRFRWHEPVEPYVRLVAGAFPLDEQDYMITLARATLKRQ